MCTTSSLSGEQSTGGPFKRLAGHLQNRAQPTSSASCPGGPAAPPGEKHTPGSWQASPGRARKVAARTCRLGTGAVEGPSTSQAAGRVTVFNEEVPQMGSGRPGGGGQAARRIPEGHDGQASEAMM